MIGELLIITAQVAFAVGVLFYKRLTPDTNPLLITTLAVVIGGLIILPLLFVFSKDVRLFTQQKWTWIILAGVLAVIGEVLYVYGLGRTTLSNAGLLVLTFPLFATALGVLFLGEAISLKFVMASLFMFVGYILLVV